MSDGNNCAECVFLLSCRYCVEQSIHAKRICSALHARIISTDPDKKSATQRFNASLPCLSLRVGIGLLSSDQHQMSVRSGTRVSQISCRQETASPCFPHPDVVISHILDSACRYHLQASLVEHDSLVKSGGQPQKNPFRVYVCTFWGDAGLSLQTLVALSVSAEHVVPGYLALQLRIRVHNQRREVRYRSSIDHGLSKLRCVLTYVTHGRRRDSL